MLLKGHRLIRGARVAVSKTEWKRRGYEIKAGEQPHGWLCHNMGCMVTYAVYRDDQVEQLVPRPRTRRRTRRKAVREVIPEIRWQEVGF